MWQYPNDLKPHYLYVFDSSNRRRLWAQGTPEQLNRIMGSSHAQAEMRQAGWVEWVYTEVKL